MADASAPQPEGAPQVPLLGSIRTWDDARAFGWITAGERVFFLHVSDLVDQVAPRPGQLVRFLPITTPRGPRAVCVSLVEVGERS